MALLPVTGLDLTIQQQDTFKRILTLYTNVQTLTLTGATGGTFTLFWQGYLTGALAYNATAASVQTALQLLTSLGAGNVTVTGSAGGPYTITWAGKLADVPINAPQPLLIPDGSLLTGTTPTIVATQGLFNLTGYTSKWAARATGGGAPGPLFSYADAAANATGLLLGTTAGTVTLYILPADTALFRWADSDLPVYNIQINDGGTPAVKTRIFTGTLHLAPAVL